jgi:hypothetical protein
MRHTDLPDDIRALRSGLRLVQIGAAIHAAAWVALALWTLRPLASLNILMRGGPGETMLPIWPRVAGGWIVPQPYLVGMLLALGGPALALLLGVAGKVTCLDGLDDADRASRRFLRRSVALDFVALLTAALGLTPRLFPISVTWGQQQFVLVTWMVFGILSRLAWAVGALPMLAFLARAADALRVPSVADSARRLRRQVAFLQLAFLLGVALSVGPDWLPRLTRSAEIGVRVAGSAILGLVAVWALAAACWMISLCNRVRAALWAHATMAQITQPTV